MTLRADTWVSALFSGRGRCAGNTPVRTHLKQSGLLSLPFPPKDPLPPAAEFIENSRGQKGLLKSVSLSVRLLLRLYSVLGSAFHGV